MNYSHTIQAKQVGVVLGNFLSHKFGKNRRTGNGSIGWSHIFLSFVVLFLTFQ